MTTKRNDSFGWQRGARGIDGSKGDDFTKASQEDMDSMFGRSYAHTGQLKKSDHEAMVCSYDRDAPPNSEVQRSAKQPNSNRPLLGKGNTQSAEQTGIRSNAKRRLSGAFG
jgi:hypothetical protein